MGGGLITQPPPDRLKYVANLDWLIVLQTKELT